MRFHILAGEEICLPLSCSARRVQVGDTCFSIAVATLTTTTAILSLNPGLDSTCSNLIGGEVLCVGPAGGNGTATRGATGSAGPIGTAGPTGVCTMTSCSTLTGYIGPTGTVPTTVTTTASSATAPIAAPGSASAVVSPPAPTSPGESIDQLPQSKLSANVTHYRYRLRMFPISHGWQRGLLQPSRKHLWHHLRTATTAES